MPKTAVAETALAETAVVAARAAAVAARPDSMQPGHAGTCKVVEKNAQDTATISTAISNNFCSNT